MPFSPHEIENKEFLVAFRGYDRDEVRAFLRAAAADYRAALGHDHLAERAELETHAGVANVLVSTKEEVPPNSALAGRRAEVEASHLRETAERDARRLINEAERQANDVRQAVERTTHERLEEVTRKTEELRALEERMRRRLYFLETALELARRDLGIDTSSSPLLENELGELPVSAKQYFPSKSP